jgi:hypothetical protein
LGLDLAIRDLKDNFEMTGGRHFLGRQESGRGLGQSPIIVNHANFKNLTPNFLTRWFPIGYAGGCIGCAKIE